MNSPILMYHRLGEPKKDSIVSGQYVTADLFDHHLRFLLRRGYRPLHLDEFSRALDHGEGKPLAITFDDGYESVYAKGLEVLTRHGAPSTVFVVAGQVGKTNAWDEAKGDVTEKLMTPEQLREVQDGGMEIGSHTIGHVDLVSIGETEARKEIVESKTILEGLAGRPVEWISYPYGRESEAVRQLVRLAGYRGACGTSRTLNTARTDRYSLARINVRSSTSVPWLIYKLFRASRKT